MKWIDFKDEIAAEAPSSCRFSTKSEQGAARMLYRGQADSRWAIETTLERAGRKHLSLPEYMRDCASARRYIGNLFPSEVRYEYEPNPDCTYRDATHTLPNYEYLAFLRHHGFPSPLLDWTESPFVAAFFAFRSIPSGVSTVAIFGYREYANDIKHWSPSEAAIFKLGPFASIHERHTAQQCQYTYCIKNQDGSAVLCPHEECLSRSSPCSSVKEQDILRKWKIDADERERVLADLFQMNITPFSLFRTIDGAVETAALRIL